MKRIRSRIPFTECWHSPWRRTPAFDRFDKVCASRRGVASEFPRLATAAIVGTVYVSASRAVHFGLDRIAACNYDETVDRPTFVA